MQATDEMNVNDINDDCLIHIFEYLSIKEKLKIEKVCKRWQRVGKLSWSEVRSIELAYFYSPAQKYLRGTVKENTDFLLNVIKRSCSYLTKVFLKKLDNRFDVLKIVEYLANRCKNIVEFGLNLDYNIKFNEKYLEILFKNNKNLKLVHLENILMKGSCFLSLNKENIEDFKDFGCELEQENDLYNFLNGSKNLKKLTLALVDTDFILEALIKNDNLNITEFSILSFPMNYPRKLKTLFQRQRNLRKINFHNSISMDKEIIESLSIESLEEIVKVRLSNELSSSLHLFKNLIVFKFRIHDFTDRYARDVANCLNLKKLSIEATKYSLSKGVENLFSRFKNIESFKLRIESGGTEQGDILVPLTKCKSLKKLKVEYMEFSKQELLKIESLPNLEKLYLTGTNVTNKILSDIVLNSLKLEYCSIASCVSINNKFVSFASRLKFKRNDHILKIFCMDSGIEIEHLRDVSPLIDLCE